MNAASDVSEGFCNSFDTTVAFEDIGDYDDTDTDSGVHNNSTPDDLDHVDTLETRTNDSLYESLKYQQGECFGSVVTKLPLLQTGILYKQVKYCNLDVRHCTDCTVETLGGHIKNS